MPLILAPVAMFLLIFVNVDRVAAGAAFPSGAGMRAGPVGMPGYDADLGVAAGVLEAAVVVEAAAARRREPASLRSPGNSTSGSTNLTHTAVDVVVQ